MYLYPGAASPSVLLVPAGEDPLCTPAPPGWPGTLYRTLLNLPACSARCLCTRTTPLPSSSRYRNTFVASIAGGSVALRPKGTQVTWRDIRSEEHTSEL